jgi:hypothetical protein
MYLCTIWIQPVPACLTGLRIGPLLWSRSCGRDCCGNDALWWVVWSWWSTSARVCISPIRSSSPESELPVSCAKSHLFGICLRGFHEAVCGEVLLWSQWSRSRWLVEEWWRWCRPATSTTMLVCNDMCGLRLVARVAMCALATVMFHDGHWGCVSVFGRFPLINRPLSSA